jgi:hypothetical protein
MRKFRKGGFRSVFALVSIFLSFCVLSSPLIAQEQDAVKSDSQELSQDSSQDSSQENKAGSDVWQLGIGLFFPLASEVLARLEPEELTIEALSALAGEAGEDKFSATLPGLLATIMEPLPQYNATMPGGGESTGIECEFRFKNQDERFFDPRDDRDAIIALDGFVTGFYSELAEGLDILLLYYELQKPLPLGYRIQALSIGDLDTFHEFILPRLFSWVSGRALSVYDIATGVFGRIAIKSKSGSDYWYSIKGSRIFVADATYQVFTLSAPGYQDMELEIDNPGPFLFRTIQAPLTRLPGPSPAQDFSQASDALEWKEEATFNKARARFSASLGRFLVSLPVSLLSVGNFLSIQEAYIRYAKPASAYYGSATFTGVSVAFSLGFTVDTIIALVDLLRISR